MSHKCEHGKDSDVCVRCHEESHPAQETIMKNTQTKIEELRDIIALDKYGKIYSALPDDGPEQDYVAGEADRRQRATAPGHTPAPWKKFWNGYYWEITAQPNPDREHSVYSPSVCSVFAPSSNEANADLIAAAPQLLAALEDSADGIDAIAGKLSPMFREALRSINARNRAAIAAAKGCR